MSITLKLDTKSFEKRLKDYSIWVKHQIAKEVKLTAMEVVTDAKLLSPSDTGRLRSSIHELSKRFDGLGVEIGSNVEYAGKMEGPEGKDSGFLHARGKHKGKGTKFLEPAIDKNREEYLSRIQKIVDKNARP